MKITYTSIDGVRKTRSFTSLRSARIFAHDCVGPQDVEGGHYAVSFDGIGKITWSGITRAQLFGGDRDPRAPKLNETTTFYSRGNQLFCREKGYTFDHENQLFGRVIEAMDNVTGDHPDGWRLRNTDQRGLFDEEARFATRDAALASAKQAMLDYLAYRNAD
jgi:hypothetical protein